MVRVLPRKVEGAIGSAILQAASRKMVNDAKLVQKSVVVKGMTRHYYEREAGEGGNNRCHQNAPTILICHGLGDEAKNYAGFISALVQKLPSNHRIVVPDALGHGEDLQRARNEPQEYQQPTPAVLLQSTIDLLDALQIKECHAFGHSMGGALVYFLQHCRPDVVRKTVLLSPAITACLDDGFLDDFRTQKKNYFAYETRKDIKILFRDLSVQNAQKRDPIPKFFLQAFLCERLRKAPKHHFRNMLNVLLEHQQQHDGQDATDEISVMMNCSSDIDCHAERLVLWPEQDAICNFERGQKFFAKSSGSNTQFVGIKGCGHMFLSDGTFLLTHVAPLVANYFSSTTTTSTTSTTTVTTDDE